MSDQLRLRPGYHNLLRREILELIPHKASAILDIGCGTGELGKAIKARQNCYYAGIELNKEAAGLASNSLDKVWQDNLNRFDPSFLRRKFDCIIFADILEHLLHPWTILDKFTSSLAEDGCIIASLPNVAHPWIISQLQKGLFRYTPAGILDIAHLRFFTQTSIFQLFCKAGLKVMKFRPYPSKENPIQYHVIAKKPKLKYKEALTTVLILSYNTWPYTIRTIDSIKRYTHTPYKILVVDNGSTDGTIAYLRADKEILHIENSCNLGFGRGFNTGLMNIDTPYFVLSNSDVIVTEGWLSKMIGHIDLDEKLVCLGPRSNYVSGPQMVQNVSYKDLDQLQIYAKSKLFQRLDPLTYSQRIVFFFTLFKSQVLSKTGFFDERFEVGNFEDDDYCMRILAQGSKCAFDNSVFIHHYGSQTFLKNKIDYKKVMEINKARFIKKWRPNQPGL